MADDKEISNLFEKFQQILKELTFHAKESSCTHSVAQLLDELESASDE